MGLEAHIAAGLSYIWILGLIFFFVEKSNRFVRFHAAQAILLGIGGIAVYVVFFILGIVAGGIAGATNSAGVSLVFAYLPASPAFSIWVFLASPSGD
jgi:uncharacterized membrane protein